MKIQPISNKHLLITNHQGVSGTISTTVERTLQIGPFLTNKANFLDDQTNVSSSITTNYEQRTMNCEIKNKANSKPKQTQYKAKTNPIRTQFKPKQTQFLLNFRVRKMLNQTINAQPPVEKSPIRSIAIRLMLKTGPDPIYKHRTRSTIKQYITNAEQESFLGPGLGHQHHRAGRNRNERYYEGHRRWQREVT